MDKNAYFRTDTANMDSTYTSAVLKVGPMLHPLVLEVVVPTIVSGDTITAKLSFSDTDTKGEDNSASFKAISAKGVYHYPFFTEKLYAFLTLTTTDAATATAQAYGGVVARIVPAGYDAQK